MDNPWIISMENPCIIYGLSMGNPFHGLSIDNPWIILGLSMDYLLIIHDNSWIIHG